MSLVFLCTICIPNNKRSVITMLYNTKEISCKPMSNVKACVTCKCNIWQLLHRVTSKWWSLIYFTTTTKANLSTCTLLHFTRKSLQCKECILEWKVTPGVNFTNIFTYSFCTCRSQKHKKIDNLTVFFYAFGLHLPKSCA